MCYLNNAKKTSWWYRGCSSCYNLQNIFSLILIKSMVTTLGTHRDIKNRLAKQRVPLLDSSITKELIEIGMTWGEARSSDNFDFNLSLKGTVLGSYLVGRYNN
ncbi:hypothetical protein BpHYR1_050348 [Brachionus plicatilis]|uniref:Uncharacterized protein n=1 Tax=Brachionus plicatilis TaxID=10195 RepID=A0A3M7T2B7_BRAPC|nr:hypothetical protein BpHYR1_050348 [Brachionus plicatilis]